LFRPDFAIGCGNGKQFAAGKFLGRTTLINIDVRGLSADDCMVRLSRRFQAEDVGAGTAENEKDLSVWAKLPLEFLDGPGRVRVVSVGDHVAIIGRGYGLHYLWVNPSVIVAGKAPFWSYGLHVFELGAD
jgi:hypothetical protein